MSGDDLSASSWTVVRFLHDETIEAVPTRWLRGNNCYWPKYDTKKLSRAIKNCEPFCDSTWDKYEIVLFRNATYDDYTKARNKCKQAEETSDLNSDLEKRKKKRPVRLSSSSGSESSDYNKYSEKYQKKKELAKKPTPLPTFHLTNEMAKRYLRNNILDISLNYSQPDDSETASSTKLLKKKCDSQSKGRKEAIGESKTNKPVGHEQNSQVLNCSRQAESAGGQGGSSSVTNLLEDKKTKEYFKQILRKLSMLELVVGDLKQEIIDLKEKNLNRPEITESNNIWEDFDLPLSTNDDLDKFEEFLSDAKNMKLSVDQLSRVGGSSVEEFVRRALKKILTTSLQTEFSWLGQKQKKKICSLRIVALVSGAAFKMPDCSDKKIEDTIKNFLKRAPERLKKNN